MPSDGRVNMAEQPEPPAPEERQKEDAACARAINTHVSERKGIVNVQLHPDRAAFSIDYDPAVITTPAVERVVEQLAETVQQRFETCTMRLGPHGGRACEACAAALEREVGRLTGVQRVTASYLGGAMSITYDHAQTTPAQLLRQVRRLGAPARPSGLTQAQRPSVRPARKSAFPGLRGWLDQGRLAIVLTAITFISMMLARFAASGKFATALFAVAYVSGSAFGLRAGLQSLRQRAIDIDLLMVLAAGGAAVVGAPFEGAMLLFLFSVSNVLQAYAMDRTRNAIRALMKLRPDQAIVRRDGKTVVLPIGQILIGDRIVVRPGDRIALDGEVLEGESGVDQASLTGESLPVAKAPGDPVFAGTINQHGSLEVSVTRLARDSTIARLIKLVEEAQSKKAPTQRFIDRAEQYYAAGVIGFTLLAIAVPILLLGEAFQPAFYRAMTLMVAASPCALVISTPAAVLSAIGNGARRGILFKGGVYMEKAAGIRVVAFDKTGTLTYGRPQATDVVAVPATDGDDALSERELLAIAASAEARSEHPLAEAIVRAAAEQQVAISTAIDFRAEVGRGVRARVGTDEIRLGNLRYFEGFSGAGLDWAGSQAKRLQQEGKTAVTVARVLPGGEQVRVLGVIGVADVLREDASEVVRRLKAQGVEKVVMLTGDDRRVAHAIAGQAGVDEYFAEMLPEDKVRALKQIREQFGTVAMVGDGVNDAPALASASIGIAMGAAGTDVALETADVVLMSDDLKRIPYLIALSRKTRKTLIANISFALAMIAVLIAGILAINLPLPLSVLGHEGGTVLVSLNGLRLLAFRGGAD